MLILSHTRGRPKTISPSDPVFPWKPFRSLNGCILLNDEHPLLYLDDSAHNCIRLSMLKVHQKGPRKTHIYMLKSRLFQPHQYDTHIPDLHINSPLNITCSSCKGPAKTPTFGKDLGCFPQNPQFKSPNSPLSPFGMLLRRWLVDRSSIDLLIDTIFPSEGL